MQKATEELERAQLQLREKDEAHAAAATAALDSLQKLEKARKVVQEDEKKKELQRTLSPSRRRSNDILPRSLEPSPRERPRLQIRSNTPDEL